MNVYKCSVCEYTSTNRSNVNKHILKKCKEAEVILEKTNTKLTCSICNKNFTTTNYFYTHMKICTLEKSQKLKVVKEYKETEQIIQPIQQVIPVIPEKITNNGHIYLIQMEPFDKNIYKIGKTIDIKRRLKEYVGYRIVTIIASNNIDLYEKELLSIFKNKFKQHLDYGIEYFVGHEKSLIEVIENYKYNKINQTNIL